MSYRQEPGYHDSYRQEPRDYGSPRQESGYYGSPRREEPGYYEEPGHYGSSRGGTYGSPREDYDSYDSYGGTYGSSGGTYGSGTYGSGSSGGTYGSGSSGGTYGSSGGTYGSPRQEPDFDSTRTIDSVPSEGGVYGGSGGSGAEPPTRGKGKTAGAGGKKPKRARWKTVLLVTGVVLALVIGGTALAGGLYLRSVEGNIERVQAFGDVPEESRPDKGVEGALNMLILGSDTRDPNNEAGSRSDTIIVAHITADKSSAQLISIPRDTWVYVPKSPDGRNGDREAKINASYAWGGIPLMVQTVEKYTGVRIDHVAIIDFAGFQEIVDAMDGIDVDVEVDFKSIHPPFRVFEKGPMHMSGAEALDYARQRYQFKDGDFARIRHQQQVIRAIMAQAASGGMLSDPGALNSFIKATSDAVAVDEDMSLIDMGSQLRHLRGDNLTFITNPTTGTGRKGSESVVLDNPEGVKEIYEAVKADNVEAILAAGEKYKKK